MTADNQDTATDRWVEVEAPGVYYGLSLEGNAEVFLGIEYDPSNGWVFWAGGGDEIYTPDPIELTPERVTRLIDIFQSVQKHMSENSP